MVTFCNIYQICSSSGCCIIEACVSILVLGFINTLRPRQNGRHFADDIFKCVFFNENAWISLQISLKFVPKFRINNITALVQIMAWRRPGDKPLSEPMMVTSLTHICVTQPQWAKVLDPLRTDLVSSFPIMCQHNLVYFVHAISVSKTTISPFNKCINQIFNLTQHIIHLCNSVMWVSLVKHICTLMNIILHLFISHVPSICTNCICLSTAPCLAT